MHIIFEYYHSMMSRARQNEYSNIKYFIRIFHPLRHIFEYFPDNEYFRIFNKFSVFDFNF